MRRIYLSVGLLLFACLLRAERNKTTVIPGVKNVSLPAPILTSVNPAIAKVGDTVILQGRYLSETSSVSFAGQAASSFLVISDTVLQAVVPSSGTGTISVTTTLGSATLSGFTHLGPRIQNNMPSNGILGTTVTINGFNFTDVLEVYVGSLQASSFTVVSDQKITAVLAISSVSAGGVKVRTINGTAEGGFFLSGNPDVRSIIPTIGKQGDTITIRGNYLFAVNTVSIGGIPAASFTKSGGGFNDILSVVLGQGSSGQFYIQSPSGASYVGFFEYLSSIQLCPFANTTLSAVKSGSYYQWQVNKGAGFENVGDSAIYSGTNTGTLALSTIPTSYYGFTYRCLIDNQFSNYYVLNFKNEWVGNNQSNWEQAGNWSCGTIPDANTDVIINAGNVMINSNVTCRSLKLGSGANITIASGYTLTVTY